MAGLRELINRENSTKSIDTRRCRCMPMCTSHEYMTEITEIDYDWSKQIEAIGYDLLDEEK